MIHYLDDFLLLLRKGQQNRHVIRTIRRILDNFGLSISEKKSDWDVKMRRKHLGVIVDLDKGTFSVPEDKVLEVE